MNTTKYKLKNITVEYSRQANEALKKKYFEENVKLVNKYINVDKKIDLINRIVRATMRNEKGDFKINSCVRYILYVMNLINEYTNLEVNFKNISEEYDLVKKTGLLEKILTIIPNEERTEFLTMLNMAVDDYMKNIYDPHSYITRQVDRFGTLISTLLAPYVDNFTDMISNLDDDKINKIGKIIEMFPKQNK